MKEWYSAPNSVLDYSKDIATPLKKVFKHLFKFTRINKNKDPKWTGPNFEDCPQKIYAGCPYPSDVFFSREYREQGDEDWIDVIIHAAVLVGIEQGRRITLEKIGPELRNLLKDHHYYWDLRLARRKDEPEPPKLSPETSAKLREILKEIGMDDV